MDTEAGLHRVDDAEFKKKIAIEHPYREWLDQSESCTTLENLAGSCRTCTSRTTQAVLLSDSWRSGTRLKTCVFMIGADGAARASQPAGFHGHGHAAGRSIQTSRSFFIIISNSFLHRSPILAD
jgi:hypothetical protein